MSLSLSSLSLSLDVVALGLESGTIPDSSLTASSMWNANHGPERARLNLVHVGRLSGAWSAGVYDIHQWLQVLPEIQETFAGASITDIWN